MTKPGTKAKKAKSENEVPLPKGSLSPKPNIMYIEVNSYTENTTLPHSNLHTMNVFSSSLPLTRNALKPPHNWIVSIDGQHSKVLPKPKAMRYAFLPKRTGRPRTSRQCLTSRDCRAEAAATAPQRVHGSQCGLTQTAIPKAAPKYTKSRLTHGKESQCARRLNDWTARKGGLGRMGYCSDFPEAGLRSEAL